MEGSVAAGKDRQRFRVVRRIASEPMPVEQWRGVERIMARLVARAYAADHPELFGPRLPRVLGIGDAGSPPSDLDGTEPQDGPAVRGS